jgi:alanine racemase
LETSPTGADPRPSLPTDPSLRPLRAVVDLGAIVANWKTFQRLSGAAECAAVVKADAYGFGAAPVAQALARAGARSFFTATIGEAMAVREALGPGPAIIVLNGPAPGEEGAFRGPGLVPCINSLGQAARWSQSRGGACVAQIDTGMNRLGLRPEEATEAAALLREEPPFLAMSHLACASDPANPMNEEQRARFIAAAAAFPQARRSLAASAGAQLGAAFHFDMIRPGVGLYGWDGMDCAATPLACAAVVTAPVLQRRKVRSGETCGYGATFLAPGDLDAAIIACGYADGFFRTGSGRAAVAFGGEALPVLGRISMDLLIVDASACPALAEGDRVEIIGPTIAAEAAAAAAGTIAYEIFTTCVGRAGKSYRHAAF